MAFCCKDKEVKGVTEKFHEHLNPRPKQYGKTTLNHSLLSCNSCHALWGRDRNAALNIMQEMIAVLTGTNCNLYLKGENPAGQQRAGDP